MKADERITHITRQTIRELLSDDDSSRGSAPAVVSHLSAGEEYLDLAHLEDGVRRAGGASALEGDMLPRKAVCKDTWAKILVHLPVPAVPRPVR
jgi:hypothetical protein